MPNNSLILNLSEYLSNNDSLLQQLIDTLPIPIFYKDRQGVYLGCNKYFENFLKIPRKAFVGKTVFQLYDTEQATLFNEADETLFNSPGVQIYESKVKSDDGTVHFVKFHKTTFLNQDNTIGGLIGVIFDITEQKKLELSLQELAIYDQLTGLYNRWEGENKAQALYSVKKRTDVNFCMLILDIDNFKAINDQFGHTAGDHALCHIAQLLKLCSRAYDTVFRYGGEEFVILLPSTEIDAAILIAERYRETIETSPLNLGSQQLYNMTASIGVSVSDDGTLDELFQRADKALYKAKNNGRNQVKNSL
jgi:diguanylate cyclase (GGDEF)-like protein/PAS domain S-box-containing protein